MYLKRGFPVPCSRLHPGLIFGILLYMYTQVIVSRADSLRPVIGILAQETDSSHNSKHGDSYIMADYVKFIEAAGAMTVPIRIDEADSYYKNLFNQVNGVLFPGGDVSILTSGYAKAGQLLYKYAVQANDRGDHFPLLGICLGFQLLSALTTGQNVLTSCNDTNILRNVKFAPDFRSSRFYGKLPSDLEKVMSLWPVTTNNHQECLTPKTFASHPVLPSFYRVIATNTDKHGLEYISIMEAHKYPFYGTQWHPEKNAFRWSVHLNINHTAPAVAISQYIADFFVSEARKSSHQFVNPEIQAKSLFENYSPVFDGSPNFESNYFFDIKKNLSKENSRKVLNVV